MSVNKTNLIIEHLTNAPNVVKERHACLRKSAEYVSIDGPVMEFGVFRGETMRTLERSFSNRKIYGFDSFEGLPEDWWFSRKEVEAGVSSHPKGHFGNVNIPRVGPNVELVKGFFDTSLPKWLEENELDQIAFLHVDCDLYSSTKTVLTLLNDYIVPGTVVVFDEMHPWNPPGKVWYELWEEGEWKALKEWLDEFDREFEVLVRSEHEQCAIKIVK